MKPEGRRLVSAIGYTLSIIASVALIVASHYRWIQPEVTETIGFVTGGWGVWLTVKENIWNWPIGIASSAFYLVLFFFARLYADMSLQGAYIVLGFLGWYWWLHGGENKRELPVTSTSLRLWAVLILLTSMSTYGMMLFLRSINDSAPFVDALTTCMSLAGQYLLTRKKIENWWVWFVTDAIYIWLYLTRELYLTAILYLLFVILCIVGLKQWRRSEMAVQVAVT